MDIRDTTRPATQRYSVLAQRVGKSDENLLNALQVKSSGLKVEYIQRLNR